jgi:hypothetical protein
MTEFPESAWVAYRWKTKDGKIACSKWLSPSDWKKQHKTQPNYRSIMPNEIVLETDFPTKETNWLVAQKITELLRQQGYGYRCFFSGNKSFHIHLFFTEMALLPEQLVRCKKLWILQTLGEVLANDVDESNCGKKHLIGIEETPHPKTGAKKTSVAEHGDWQANAMPESILQEAKKEPKVNFVKQVDNIAPKHCLLIQWACENKLPVSCRNQNLVPNVVAFTQDRKVWQQCANTQGKQVSEFENWAARKPQFNCRQLQVYGKKIGISVCNYCRGQKNGE